MGLGIAQRFIQAADLQKVNATLANTDLVLSGAAGQNFLIKALLMVNVGATGGIRVLFSASSAPTRYELAITLQNTVAPSQATAMLVASATFTNALANAGNHFVQVEGNILFNAAATLTVQFAQNTTDVLTGTLLAGSWMEAVLL